MNDDKLREAETEVLRLWDKCWLICAWPLCPEADGGKCAVCAAMRTFRAARAATADDRTSCVACGTWWDLSKTLSCPNCATADDIVQESPGAHPEPSGSQPSRSAEPTLYKPPGAGVAGGRPTADAPPKGVGVNVNGVRFCEHCGAMPLSEAGFFLFVPHSPGPGDVGESQS